MRNMERLERIVAELPEAKRVDIEEWGDHPSFRVRGKNFVFCDAEAQHVSLKLPSDEAAAAVTADSAFEPSGYGLGRHGWVSLTISASEDDERWTQIKEWVRTSYTLIAPKRLAQVVLDADS